MDYGALGALRTAVQHLYDCQDLEDHTSEKTSSRIREAQLVASEVACNHVIRELQILPTDVRRLHVISFLGCGKTSAAFRRAVVSSRDLLSIPKDISSSKADAFRRAVAFLVVRWREALEKEKDRVVRRELDVLAEEHATFLAAIENEAHREMEVSPQAGSAPQRVSRALSDFVDDFDRRQNSIAGLERQIDEAVGILDEAGMDELRAGGHDGIHEVVTSMWALLRAEYKGLNTLVGETQRLISTAVDAITKLRATDLVSDTSSAMQALQLKHKALLDCGFDLPEISSMQRTAQAEPSAAIADDSESDDCDDEDDWEDAVEIESKPAEVEPEKEILPPVKDWVSVMKGKEDRDTNRLLLERFERQATERSSAEGSSGAGGSGIDVLAGLERGAGEMRGQGRGARRGRGAKGSRRGKASSARQRLSAALGIRKKKKKKLD